MKGVLLKTIDIDRVVRNVRLDVTSWIYTVVIIDQLDQSMDVNGVKLFRLKLELERLGISIVTCLRNGDRFRYV